MRIRLLPAMAAAMFLSHGATALANAECGIDQSMRKTREALIKAETRAIEDGLRKPSMETVEKVDAKNGSCLPSLDDLGAMIQGRIPGMGDGGFGFGSIFSAMKDMACQAGDDFIKDTVNSLEYSIGDPYGIASVGIGGSTSGSSTDIDDYDIGEAIKGGVKDAASDKVHEAIRDLPSTNQPTGNRPNAGSGGVSQGVKDALKNL